MGRPSYYVKLQTGHPIAGVLPGGDKPPLLAGGLLGQTESMRKAGLHARQAYARWLALRQGGQRSAEQLLSFPDCFIIRPGPSQANLWPHVLRAAVWRWTRGDQDGKRLCLGRQRGLGPELAPGALWWPLLAPTQQHPGFMRAATVSYSLTSHPLGVKENHTGPASPVEHGGC